MINELVLEQELRVVQQEIFLSFYAYPGSVKLFCSPVQVLLLLQLGMLQAQKTLLLGLVLGDICTSP